MKTTKQLLKELENKSEFWLAWSIMWRMWIIGCTIGMAYGFLTTI